MSITLNEFPRWMDVHIDHLKCLIHVCVRYEGAEATFTVSSHTPRFEIRERAMIELRNLVHAYRVRLELLR